MSKGLATELVEAFEMVEDLPEGVAWPESPSAEVLARMDWAAELTDEDIDHLKRGLALLKCAAKARGDGDEKRAITRLADELEVLP